MEISVDTKYNVGQNVFILNDIGIEECKVEKIVVKAISNDRIIIEYGLLTKYKGYELWPDYNVFGTPEDIVKDLLDKFELSKNE